MNDKTASESMEPSILQRVDTWLARNHPVLWVTRASVTFLNTLVYFAIICGATLLLVTWGGRPNPGLVLLETTLISGIYLIFYFMFMGLFSESAASKALELHSPSWKQISISFVVRLTFLAALAYVPFLAEHIAQGGLAHLSFQISAWRIPVIIYLAVLWSISESMIQYAVFWWMLSAIIILPLFGIIRSIFPGARFVHHPLFIAAVFLVWEAFCYLLNIFVEKKHWKLLGLAGLASLPIVVGFVEIFTRGRFGLFTWIGIAVFSISIGVLRDRFTYWNAMP